MPTINIANSKGRDAVVGSVRHREKIT